MKKLLQGSFILQFIANPAIVQDRTVAEIPISWDDGLSLSSVSAKIGLQFAATGCK